MDDCAKCHTPVSLRYGHDDVTGLCDPCAQAELAERRAEVERLRRQIEVHAGDIASAHNEAVRSTARSEEAEHEAESLRETLQTLFDMPCGAHRKTCVCCATVRDIARVALAESKGSRP